MFFNSERERQIHDIAYMWNLKQSYRWTYLQNRNRVTDIENTYGYQSGEAGGKN